MARDFDQFPLYDDIVRPNTTQMTGIWVDALATFFETLVGYLSQGGILLPPLTTEERDALEEPDNGQMIYNTTLDSAQYYKAGVWTSF